jgi:hypothetical protein
VKLIVASVLLLYGFGAWAFSKRVLPRWRYYAGLAEDSGLRQSAQFLIGSLCAAVWPLAWLLLAGAGITNHHRP